MTLDIKFSIKLEKERIKNTLERLPWYESHNYSPRFPKDISPKTDSHISIFQALQNEYTAAEYEKIAKQLNSEFSKIENVFFEKLGIIIGKKVKRNYQLILTKYGVGGSYRLPNKIIYNFAMKSSSINTIMHEIVHLIIEPYIIKYDIGQNEKERIVDLILKSEPIALKNYKMQKRGEEYSSRIDPIFKKYFKSSIDTFFKELKD